MSTLKVATIQDTSGNNSSTPAGIASGTAKAWVNFNGTGTVAIRDDFNVSSVTDQNTGRYTVNLTNAMGTAENYCVSGSTGAGAGGDVTPFDSGGAVYVAPTSTAFRVRIANTNGAHTDQRHVMIVVHGA